MPSPAKLEDRKHTLAEEREQTRVRIKESKQLLVEGKDPKNFFGKFICHLYLQNIQVQDFSGINELHGFLLAFVKLPGFSDCVSSLGIVRDAEKNAKSAFQSVQSAVKNAGLSVPAAPGKRSAGSPAVTAYILPGDGKPGMLETLLCRSFDAEPVRVCIDDFFSCVDDRTGSQPTLSRDKARAHAYLTTKDEPHVSVGVAAKKCYWTLDHSAFADLRNFLTSL